MLSCRGLLALLCCAAALPVDDGPAVALPSIQTSADEETALAKKRKIYGGKGDKQHLGGFTSLDIDGLSPSLWRWMVSNLTVHSLLDVGCGKGVSTSWFLMHGVDANCVEGSHDGVAHSLLPPDRVVEHDFSRGPWWPAETVDVVWCVEFLEHVGCAADSTEQGSCDRTLLLADPAPPLAGGT